MSDYILERQRRRPTILNGVSQGFKNSEIATQLGVERWIITKDLKMMRRNGDAELKEAQRAQERLLAEKLLAHANVSNDWFTLMTGMTFQEKTFNNMIIFYKPELMRILRSGDQYAAIMKLPKSVRRTLLHNGIITNRRLKGEITSRARACLP
jgi:hypothetical protein